MLCSNCGNNEAVFHTTKLVDGVETEIHLCEKCMFKSDDENKNNFFNPIITKNCCKTCGCSFDDFLKTGLLGCSDCYKYFKDDLKNIIMKLQGSLLHYGKQNEKDISEDEKEYMELNRQLKEAVYLEDYELASILKEQILKLRDRDGY